jgi:hypothetical protein
VIAASSNAARPVDRVGTPTSCLDPRRAGLTFGAKRVTVPVVRRDPHRPSLLVFALVVLAALGACTLAVASIAPTLLGGVDAWPAIAGGTVVLLAALAALWVIQRRRDRTLW